jgi:hypothetical protein
MGFLDRSLSNLTMADLQRIVTLEVSKQIPAIPTGVLGLADSAVPLVPPEASTVTAGQVLTYAGNTNSWIAKTITSATAGTDGGTPVMGAVTLISGPGWLQAKWDPATGTSDPIQYKVFIRQGSAPTVSDNTYLVGTVTTLSLVINTLADHATQLSDANTYHVIVVPVSSLSGHTGAGSTDVSGSPAAIDASVTTINNLNAGHITTGDIAAARMETNFLVAASATVSSLSAITATLGAVTAGTITATTLDATNSIDAGAINAGTIDVANRINAGTIGADKLSATLTFSNVFQTTAASGVQKVVIDGTAGTGGVFLYDNTGQVIVSLPLAGTPSFTGTITTGGITITGNLLIQGTTNVMDKGSQLTLNEKLSNANTPPVLSMEYDTLTLSGVTFGYTPGAIHYDALGGSGGSTPVFYVCGVASGSSLLFEVDASSGAVLRSVNLGPGDDTAYGVTRVPGDSSIWVLIHDGFNVAKWVKVSQSAFTVTTTTSATSLPSNGYSVTGVHFGAFGQGGFGVGTDGTYVLVLGWASTSNGAVKTIKRFDMSSGSPVLHDTQSLINGQTFVNPLGISKTCVGITSDGTNYWTLIGRFTSAGAPSGYMLEKYVISTLTLGTGTGDTQTDNDYTGFQAGGGVGSSTMVPIGVTWDGTHSRLCIGSASTTIARMTSWLPSGSLLWVGYAWQIADTVVDTGTFSIGAGAVFTDNSLPHGLAVNDEVFFTNSGGSLPTGVTANTSYYVLSSGLTATAFKFSTTKGGSAVTTSGSQSGTTTLHKVLESLVSPLSSINLKDSGNNQMYRRRIRVTTPAFPSSINHAPIYALVSASAPATSALLKERVSSGFLSQDSASPMLISGEDSGGQAPRTTSNLTGATSTITASAASWTSPWQLRGDGTFTFPSVPYGSFPSSLEVQTLTISGAPTGGTFDLGYVSPGPNGGLSSTLTGIAYNVLAATLQTNLNGIKSITDSGGVTCSGGPLNTTPIVVTFVKGGARPLLTLANNALTGGTAPTVTIARSTAGLPVVGQVAYDSKASAPATWDGVAWRYDALDDWALGGEGLREALFVMAGVQRGLKAQNYEPWGAGNLTASKLTVVLTSGRRVYEAIYWPGGLFTGYLWLQGVVGSYTDAGGASGFQLMGGSSAGPVTSSTTTLTVITGSNRTSTSIFKGSVSLRNTTVTPFYLPAGIYYVNFMWFSTATTTTPELVGLVGGPFGATGDLFNNAGVMAPSGFFIHGVRDSQSALAASTEAISNLDLTATNGPWWVGLY